MKLSARAAAKRNGPAASAAPDEIEFACAHNRYLERQFDLEIVDDLGGKNANPGCKGSSTSSEHRGSQDAERRGKAHLLDGHT